MTDSSPLRVGLVGAGVIARLAQLPVLSADETVTIAGVVTATPQESDAAVRRWPIGRAYPDLEAMIADARLDALFVLTPKTLHEDAITTGLRAGLHVYSEKPLASTLHASQRLADFAEASAGQLMVGLNRRFAPVYVHARKAFADAPPQFIVGQKHRVGSEYRATLENGIHMIDLLRWFCGEAVEVTARAAADDPYQEDGISALIGFDSGATAAFIAARTAGEWDERLEAYGDQTTVRVVAPDEVTITRHGESRVRHQRPRSAGWADITETAGFAGAISHFLDCVRSGARPQTDAREAVLTQQLTESILAAAGLPFVDRA